MPLTGATFAVEDPRSADVRELLVRHHAFMREHSPPEDIHALDVDGLLDPAVTFFSLRRAGALLAVGAIKRLDDEHAELKSMHTVEGLRGQGVGRAMVERLLDVARERGFGHVSIETGTQPAFAPAHALYTAAGFTECAPFGDYRPSAASRFMTRAL